MGIKEMEKYNNYKCACGKIHNFSSEIVTGDNIINQLPSLCDKYSAQRIFVLCDQNTYKAAGQSVVEILNEAHKEVNLFTYTEERVVPDETSIGLAFMHFDPKSDLIIGVGSGVINDIGKVVANIANKPYFIVATATSMDGYASATSSVEREGIKISLNSKCPEVIIGDYEILSVAPIKAMLSGLGGPVSLEEIGVENDLLPSIFTATKDIRNKYCLSFLAWDLGLVDELLKNIWQQNG